MSEPGPSETTSGIKVTHGDSYMFIRYRDVFIQDKR